MAAQKQDDQHERTFSSYVRIQDVVLKTYLGRWTIGRSGERGSGISVLPARYDDDDFNFPNGIIDNTRIHIYLTVSGGIWTLLAFSMLRVFMSRIPVCVRTWVCVRVCRECICVLEYIYIYIYIYILGTVKSRLGETVVGLFLTHEIIFVTILLYLVLSTFCTCSLAAIYSVFSFDQSIEYLLILFNWYDKVGLFCFSNIYFPPIQWLVVYFYLRITWFFPLTVSAIIMLVI